MAAGSCRPSAAAKTGALSARRLSKLAAKAAGKTSRSHTGESIAYRAVCQSMEGAAAAAARCIVPGCITVYGCPLAYEVFLLQIRFNLEEPSDTETASVSSPASTKLTSTILN